MKFAEVAMTQLDARARARFSKGLFLLAAGLSFVASIYLWFRVDRDQGLFVGLWVPSILSLGTLLTGRESDERRAQR